MERTSHKKVANPLSGKRLAAGLERKGQVAYDGSAARNKAVITYCIQFAQIATFCKMGAQARLCTFSHR